MKSSYDSNAVRDIFLLGFGEAEENVPPVAEDVPAGSYIVDWGAALLLQLSATDSNSYDQDLRFVTETQPAHGSLHFSYEAGLPWVAYTPDPDWFGDDSFSFRSWDYSSASAPATVVITVRDPRDQAPFLDLDVAKTGIDATVVYPLNDGPVSIARSGAVWIADADSASLAWATITLINHFDGNDEALALNSPGALVASYDRGTGILHIDGGAAPAEYAAAIESVVYSNTAASPDTSPREIAVVVSDSVLQSPTAYCSIFLSDDSRQISLEQGWNLVSLPFDTPPWIPMPGAAWTWAGRYRRHLPGKTEGQSIWLYSPHTATTVPLPGRQRDGILSLHSGWNLIGPVVDIPVEIIRSRAKITGPALHWDAVQQHFRTVANGALMHRGRGYWIHVSKSIDINTRP